MTPGVNRLHSYLISRSKNANYHMACDAGFSGFWMQRLLAAKGINCKVVHPVELPSRGIKKLGKTDAVDSKKIPKGLKMVIISEKSENFTLSIQKLLFKRLSLLVVRKCPLQDPASSLWSA